jgi:hypothetical protein
MKYVVEMASYGMTYILSFMMNGIGIQTILRFFLRNLWGCDGVTDEGFMNYAV